VREKGGDGETLSCWRERGYFDQEETSGPMDVPVVEKVKMTLKQRLLNFSKKWKSRGQDRAKEKEWYDANGSDEEDDAPPPYMAQQQQRSGDETTPSGRLQESKGGEK
jgi:hypothetical protein